MADDTIPNGENARKSWAENMILKFPPVAPTGQPEKRRYRMIYLLDDVVVGTYSDEVVATTMA